MIRNFLAGFILLVSLSTGIGAQDLDQDCNPLVEPPECQRLLDAIESLDTRIGRLQERLRDASPAMKPGLLRSINQLNSQRSALRAEVARCRSEHGATPRVWAPGVLRARFTGTATVRAILAEVPAVDLDLVLQFTRNRCHVIIAYFPPLKLKPEAEASGRLNAQLIRIFGGGAFHPVSGNMTMSIGVQLESPGRHRINSRVDAVFRLSTGNSVEWGESRLNLTGSPLTEGGSITLVGTAQFQRGVLEGRSGSLVITGNISPHP
ncbi:MAG: hypothetical protein ND895_14170 [Pyrinomonadaceae bacterium]|nr:hypothetical protein [Pyrinomonadaceae bacterium]